MLTVSFHPWGVHWPASRLATRGIPYPLCPGACAPLQLSIEDIAVQIEEPFAVLPLETHHQWLLRDAEETRTLMRWYGKPQSRDT